MTVLGPPNAAFGRDFSSGFEFANTGGVTNFGFQSEGMGMVGNLCFFLETGLGPAKHEEAFLNQGEVFLFGEFDVKASAFEREVTEEFPGSFDVAFGGMSGKEPDPAGETGRETGPEEERTPGIEHPFESLSNDARGGEWDEV